MDCFTDYEFLMYFVWFKDINLQLTLSFLVVFIIIVSKSQELAFMQMTEAGQQDGPQTNPGAMTYEQLFRFAEK